MAKFDPLGAVLRGAIIVYRYTLSAFIGRTCRYAPSCSEYALEAIQLHGSWKGGKLALKRIARCHPWGGHGFDPVPGPLNEIQENKKANP